jgi:O-antigen/teichoic acid export membrane protein
VSAEANNGVTVLAGRHSAARGGSLIERVCSGSFGSDLVVTFATNAVTACIGLVTGVLAARLLGPQGRGELAAIQAWPTAIAYLSLMGLAEATVYFSACEPNKAGRYFSSGTTLALMFGLPVGMAAYFLMPAFLTAQTAQVVHAARWYLLIIPVLCVVSMPFSVLRGRNDLVVWNVLRVTPNISWLLVLVGAWALGAATPEVLAFAFLAALIVLSVPVLAVSRRRTPGSFRPDHRLWKPMLRYGLPSAGASVPQMFNLRLDQMLMAALLPPHLLGLYVAAVAWSGAAGPATNAIGAVIFPRVASQLQGSTQVETLGRASRMGTASAAALCGCLLLLTPLAVPLLFGRRFVAAIPAALILTVGGAVLGLNNILQEGVRGLGDTKAVLWSELSGLVVTVGALLLLLRPYGIVGAAVASLLAYGTVTVTLLVRLRSTTGSSAADFLWPRAHDFVLARHRILALVKG